MTRQVELCLCLSALSVLANAFPSDNSLKLDETITHANNGSKSQYPVDRVPEPLDLTPSVYRKVEKPVNEVFPHAVLYGRTCGGSIISPKWILTAAHCTISSTGRFVLAGTNRSRNGGGVTRLVKRKVIHPRFSVGPYWLNAYRFNINQVGARFDYMLVELDEPLEFNNVTITAAKLNENLQLPAGTNVGYAGYGAKNHGETMRHLMHEMKLQLLSEDKCKVLQEYSSQDMICAKGRPSNNDSACNGDSGAGLVDENGVLVGVLSWAENDARICRNDSIIYFSKVAEVRQWIREVANV